MQSFRYLDDDTIESLLNDDLFSQLATQTPSESEISYDDNGERLDNEEESLPPCTRCIERGRGRGIFCKKINRRGNSEVNITAVIVLCICKKNKLLCTVKCSCQSKCRNLRKEELDSSERTVESPLTVGPINVKHDLSIKESFQLIWTPDIQSRSISGIAVTLTGSFIYVTVALLRFAIGRARFPCLIFSIVSYTIAPCFAMPSILRCLRLVFQHRFNLMKSEPTENMNIGKFLQKRKLYNLLLF